MSGDPNVLYDGNHLDVLRRHVRDESIDLVYGVSSDPWWQEVMERAFGWVPGRQRPRDAAGRSRRGFVS
jgi:hypothetical protein